MHIVLVGAGGTGMSGVAGLLYDLGFQNLICIDGVQSQLTDKLKEKGLKVIIGHGNYKVQQDDKIIYSEATVESIEVKTAREIAKKIKRPAFLMNYFQFLGEISKYFVTVGFAGTNGKSSSSAMAIYTANKVLPNFGLGILGALVPDFANQSYIFNKNFQSDLKNIFDFIFTGKGLNYENIKKHLFLVEACEYKRHFLHLDLDYAIITSLELDHTDYYKDQKDYDSAFVQLINKVKQNIFVPDNLKLSKFFDTKKIIKTKIGKINFKKIWGKYNDINGSLVLALLKKLSLSAKKVKNTMLNFGGLRRRLELLFTSKKGAIIFTDYGHMASSIAGGYETLKQKYPNKKIICIFQPHQINRIINGRNDFKKAMKKYDEVIIYDIFAARESLDLAKKMGNFQNLNDLGNHFARQGGGIYTTKFEDITKKINNSDKNTVIIIFTAGNLDYKLRNYYLK
ncbi:MAG: cyanophycin synthetase [Candidatus Absconditabacterales bacterium]